MSSMQQPNKLDGQYDGPVAVGGGEAVDQRDSPGAIYKPSGPVRQHFGPRVLLPLGGIVSIALALVISTVVFNIGPLAALLPTPIPTPTPMAFPAAQGDETLIIVADFEYNGSGNRPPDDPAQYIYEKLIAQARENELEVHIERLHEIVNDHTAQNVGEVYSATLVVWGTYGNYGISPRLERIGDVTEYPSTQEESPLSLSEPEAVFLSQLPARSSYLTFFVLGLTEYIDGNSEAAWTYFDSALEAAQEGKDSTNPAETYFYRGNLLSLWDRLDEAIQQYSRAIELDPSYMYAYGSRGWTHYKMEAYELALADYGQAIALDPEDAYGYDGRGWTYQKMGEYELALDDFDRAIALNPEYVNAYNGRGWTYYRMEEYDLALGDHGQAIALDPEDTYGYDGRGWTYQKMGEYELALDDFDRAVALNPEYVNAYNGRGWTYYRMEEYEVALEDFDRAITLDPGDAYGYDGRGWAYHEMGEYGLALEDFDQAIELDPTYADAYNGRGWTYYYMEEYELALTNYDQAIALDPEHANAHYNRGLIYLELERYDSAIADFERFLELSSDPYWREQAEQHLRELRGD